jgi:protein gp37
MGTTNIAYVTKSWNPWQGCRKVSAGCDHCYMYTERRRYGLDPVTVVRSKTTFADPLKKWREPERILTCSWTDWFIADADPWRPEAWDIVRQTPRHTYLVLTKRPRRIRRCLPADWGAGWSHVWLGTSVETMAMARKRLPVLQRTPAAVRWLSIEPLLEPLDMAALDLHGIDFLVVGGESGAGYRPMPHEWVWPIRDACVAHGIAFWFKQSAGPRAGMGAALRHEDGTEHVWCALPTTARRDLTLPPEAYMDVRDPPGSVA